MRIKPDGTLDEVWRVPPAKMMEQLREEMINSLLRARPTLTREKAAEQIDAVFKGAVTA